MMRKARWPNGEKRFPWTEYLRPTVIKTQFSRMCALLKYGTNDPNEAILDELEQETSAILVEQAKANLMEAMEEDTDENEKSCPMEVCNLMFHIR